MAISNNGVLSSTTQRRSAVHDSGSALGWIWVLPLAWGLGVVLRGRGTSATRSNTITGLLIVMGAGIAVIVTAGMLGWRIQ